MIRVGFLNRAEEAETVSVKLTIGSSLLNDVDALSFFVNPFIRSYHSTISGHDYSRFIFQFFSSASLCRLFQLPDDDHPKSPNINFSGDMRA